MRLVTVVLYILESVFTWLRENCSFCWHIVDALSLLCLDIVRLFAGFKAAGNLSKCKRPAKPLKLYEFEGCPFCRKVRETLSCLDIDHEVYPCPRETLREYGVCLNSRFRTIVRKEGGKVMFPFLVDPNTNTKMYDSDEIITYLWTTYGSEATKPWNYRLALNPIYLKATIVFVAFFRPCMDMGILRAPSKIPEKSLEFYGIESCAGSRRVKETLATLELPYMFHVFPMGGDSEKWKKFQKDYIRDCRVGCGFSNMMKCCGKLPFLRDPNTSSEIFGSSKIVAYLKTQYQTSPVPAESWLDKHQ